MRVLRIPGLALALLVWLAPAALAHPHMWVTVKSTILYANGNFTGFRFKWTFDEFYTAMAIEGLDKNNDGVYDRKELAGLAKVNIDGLKEYDDFTYVVAAGEHVKLQDARDYWLEHSKGILSLHFTVPFARPVPANTKDFAFVVRDPTNFIAFGLEKTDPVKFARGAPNNCTARVVNPRPDSEGAKNLVKAFAQLGVSATHSVLLDCALARGDCPPRRFVFSIELDGAEQPDIDARQQHLVLLVGDAVADVIVEEVFAPDADRDLAARGSPGDRAWWCS